MKRQHLDRLAAVLASVRGELSVSSFEILLLKVGEVCSDANPAFEMQRFRGIAKAESFVKSDFTLAKRPGQSSTQE